ncbi:MAG TPA: SHOCT domain-containing protein [Actinomycetota bacterium]|nr:SHOCT domain-containing protein [Actinomycetota bacterium]
MSRAVQDQTIETIKGSIAIFLSLAGVACGLTMLYLGMRAVMEIGGACADGGPFVPVRPCPKGVPLLTIGGIFGGIASFAFYLWQAFKRHVPNFAAFTWPALFLSLGYNFLDFGLNPPGRDGLEWGWLICAILFGLMGGLPLLALVGPTLRGFGQADPPTPGSMKPLAATRLVIRRSAATSARQSDPGTTRTEWVDELERLARLHAAGELTDDEWAAAKRRLLGEDAS